MATTTKTISYEEWLQMPVAEDVTEEVVNGEIRIMPPNKWKHTMAVYRLQQLLQQQVDQEAVYVITPEFGLLIRREPLTCRVPDLAMFIAANIIEEDGYILSPPELVVEVLSPSNTRTEREEKLRDYESLGVPEVWVLSPEARTIEVLLLQAGKLRTVQVLREGRLRPQRFPEVVIDVAAVWPK